MTALCAPCRPVAAVGWCWLILAWATSATAAAPAEDSAYSRAALRIEARGHPNAQADAAVRQSRETALARAGVQARWIQVVDNEGSPLIANPYLPCDDPQAEENEAILRAWVSEMHDQGMAVLSWYPLTFCQSGWEQHPEWRQEYIVPWRSGLVCCISTEYGDRLIDYCKYAIERLGLDGIWFDGSVWTVIWEQPYPLSCRCAACRERFRADTGEEIPEAVDWGSPVFRRWVNWRYDQFGTYIGRLAREIRATKPDAAVVINHYHRPGIPWNGAIPLNPYDADIISGSEAAGFDLTDLTMRLCRAYGRPQSEVWRAFTVNAEPTQGAEELLQHALTCYAAGGHPSFGGDSADPKMATTAALMTPIMDAIRPWVGGAFVRHVALHLSQQTETFHYGPVQGPFWPSVSDWTTAMGEAGLPPDYIYDRNLTDDGLAGYRVLLMPQSVALSDEQARAALEFAREGGLLVLGPGAGQLDEEACIRMQNPLGHALGFAFPQTRRANGSDTALLKLAPAPGVEPALVRPGEEAVGVYSRVRLRGPGWQPLVLGGIDTPSEPVLALREYGKGHVLLCAVDPSRTFGVTPCAEGDTVLSVTDETAASGRYSLKYVDAESAPQSFHPDLESRVLRFGAPAFSGGELSCNLRTDGRGYISIELRPSVGPIVQVAGAQVVSGGQTVAEVEPGQWFRLRVRYDFAAGERPSSYEVTVTAADGAEATARLATPAPDYAATDWFVIYGAGASPAEFYLDDLNLVGIRADGARVPSLALDFERGPDTFGDSPGHGAFLARLAELIGRSRPPRVQVEATGEVRSGVFHGDPGTVRVHLYNRSATRSDWGAASGSPAVIRCAFPVRSARSALTGKAFAVSTRDGRSEVSVPSFGLYEVVTIRGRVGP